MLRRSAVIYTGSIGDFDALDQRKEAFLLGPRQPGARHIVSHSSWWEKGNQLRIQTPAISDTLHL